MFVNNRKARTGEIVEVAIYGEPGAYVGLSGIDRPFYSLQLGNELTYAKVSSMAGFSVVVGFDSIFIVFVFFFDRC